MFHSRPYSPTRRVALGHAVLPVDPPPGFGGILLGGIVAAHMNDLDVDMFDDLHRLTLQLQDGMRIPQPRLRHRFQTDHVGLARSHHRLVGDGERVSFELETNGASSQQVLAAVYAAAALPHAAVRPAMDAVRKGMRWWGPVGPALVAHLAGRAGAGASGWTAAALGDPVAWALGILGFDVEAPRPKPRAVQQRFRVLLRDAHPDHGAEIDGAAERIAELTTARRVLLG